MTQPPATLTSTDKKIIQILQDQFPLTERPYQQIANQLNLTETQVLNRIKHLTKQGITPKIGAIIDTQKSGYAATLVALKVPPHKIDEVSAVINQYSGISHNYQREHAYNVWFTLRAATKTALDNTLSEIAQKTSIAPKDTLNLPTKQCFKIQVRFQLT
ncbi:MAG: AsnC family transcriptional regulator [Candidatus Bathyarchaeota archaeon]|nr:AsnC family transcriptional regulator [Candidatus Bathyarchaeota archaeon]